MLRLRDLWSWDFVVLIVGLIIGRLVYEVLKQFLVWVWL